MSDNKGSYREVMTLAYPAVLSMLSWTAMWTADTIFVGRVGTAQQGAVGFAGTVAWTAICIVNGTITAVQIFVAQYKGAGQHGRCGEILWQGLYFSFAAALPIGILAFHSEWLIKALRVTPELVAFSTDYLKIRLLGAVFVFVSRGMELFLQGTGDTRTPLKVSVLANGFNILMDYVLIFGKWGFPEMGVTGAALATVLATAIQAGIYFYLVLGRESRSVYFPRKVSPLAPRRLIHLLRVGFPVGLQWLLDMGTWTVFTTIIARLGDIQAAAHQIAVTILHVSFMPGYGISIATTTLVGQYLGAGDKKAAIRSAYTSLRLAIVFMGAMGVLFYVFRAPLVRMFNPDPAVVATGATLLIFAAVFQVFDATGMVCSGALRGSGDTRWPMAVSIGIAWFLFVPLVYLTVIRLSLGVTGGWMAAAIYIVSLGGVLFGGLRKRKWMERRLVAAEYERPEGAPLVPGPDAMSPSPPVGAKAEAR
jgi:MATE family multidrug resistance protein